MSDRPERDLGLERLLGSLEAPPAKARFHDRLWERIDAVDTTLLVASLQVPPAKARFHERLWERIDGAETMPAERRSRRWVPRLAAAALATAAVAVYVAVSLVGWPGSREGQGILSGPPPAVAQVIQNVRLRLDSCRSLSAIFTYQRAGEPLFRARVLVTSDGRVRTAAIAEEDGSWRLPPASASLADTPGLRIEVSSIPDGTRTEAWNSPDGLTVARSVNLAAGPPDAAGSGLFPAEYAGQMSALAIADAKVSSSTYAGRRVLVVSAPAGSSALPSGASAAAAARFDRVSMVVDRDTWLPIRVIRTYKGAVTEAWGLNDVQLGVPLAASDFTVQLPSSAELITGRDQGFRRVSLQKASTAVNGRLFIPATVPDGFTLSLAAVRTQAPTLQKPLLSSHSAVASLVYRRGFRSIVVTTRSFSGGFLDAVDDPFVRSSSHRASRPAVVLRAGGLAGASAHVVAQPLGLPHLWALQDGLLVTVSGDVTRRELRRIAESLETYGVWRTGSVFTAYAAATKGYDLSALSDLYARGVEIDGRSYAAKDTEDALIRNSELTDYFVSGRTVSTFIANGTALWEAWPGAYVSVGGWYSPEAVAEVVTVRGGNVAREEFFSVGGPMVKASEASPHPARLDVPLGDGDSSSAARRVASDYGAALKQKDAAKLARMSAPDVVFLDVGYGDHGRRPALLRRYERMFAFPADLSFSDLRTFSGPGWAVVRWTASSESLGYDEAAGLTVLEMRNGKVARETLYCAKGDMPFR